MSSGAEPLSYAQAGVSLDAADAIVERVRRAVGSTRTARVVGDLGGFALGIAERDELIDGSAVSEGDAVIGLASSGLHANGFTLVRRLLERAGVGPDDAPGDLLAPTRIYARASAALRAGCEVRGM